jgi:polyhydroxybutyrate depolymerase
VYVPDGQANAWPVVLAFHGLGTSGRSMIEFSGLADKAEEAGFLAVFPDGSGPTPQSLAWNAGNCCSYAHKEGVDDVAFVAALLDDLALVAPLDERRLYATGFSNGAMLAYLLASQMADRIAAIAPVAGPMGTADCRPSRPVSVCHFHGLADEFAPFRGGIGRRSVVKVRQLPVENSLACWVRADGCRPEPQVEWLEPLVNDGTRACRTTWSGGREGSEVVLYAIEGAGHVWPGRVSPFTVLGRPTNNLVANDVLWNFFQSHPR